MTSRERMLATLNHTEPDGVAIDFAGTDVSSAHAIAYDKLRKHIGKESGPMRLACLIQLPAEGDDEIQDHLHADATVR